MPVCKLISGSSHPELANAICKRLATKPVKVTLSKFSNGETSVEIGESVREKDVFVLQSVRTPSTTGSDIQPTGTNTLSDDMIQLLIIVSACKTASAGRVIAVLPMMLYSIQKVSTARSHQSHTPSLIARMLEEAGVNQIITLDLINHRHQMQQFNVTVDSVPGDIWMTEWIRSQRVSRLPKENVILISTDPSEWEKTNILADRFNFGRAPMCEYRDSTGPTKLTVGAIQAAVSGKIAILIGSVIDTGRTIIAAAKVVKEMKASRVIVLATHGVFSGDAITQIDDTKAIDSVVVTNTVAGKFESDKLEVFDVTKILSNVIGRVRAGTSLEVLYSSLRGA